MPTRIAVLASGGGSNLQAILDHRDALDDACSGEVALVASDRADAGALRRAALHGVQTEVLDGTARSHGLAAILREHDIGAVVLAGYLRRVPSAVTSAYRGRMLNIHPALLPAFGGRGMFGEHVHKAVLASGARLTGATVHFVDAEYDHGPIVAQWPVPAYGDDTPATLAARVLAVEHLLYPRVIQAVCAGRIRLNADGRVEGWGAEARTGVFALASDTRTAVSSLRRMLGLPPRGARG
jgi:phosphoribosylglycinamide formyltransferase 1